MPVLKDMDLDKVLDYVVRSAGVSYKKMDDGTYIIGGNQETVPIIAPREIADILPPVDLVNPLNRRRWSPAADGLREDRPRAFDPQRASAHAGAGFVVRRHAGFQAHPRGVDAREARAPIVPHPDRDHRGRSVLRSDQDQFVSEWQRGSAGYRRVFRCCLAPAGPWLRRC